MILGIPYTLVSIRNTLTPAQPPPNPAIIVEPVQEPEAIVPSPKLQAEPLPAGLNPEPASTIDSETASNPSQDAVTDTESNPDIDAHPSVGGSWISLQDNISSPSISDLSAASEEA